MTERKTVRAEALPPPSDGVRDDRLMPTDPYVLMSEFGVGFATTARELHLAGIEAQATNRLDPARAKAWADLRSVEKRLVLDLTFAEVPLSEPLPNGAIPMRFEPLAPPSIEALAAELPVPTIAPPAAISSDLPLPSLDAWQLAAELLAGEKPIPFVLSDPEPFINAAEERAK
jgi:hypothetical protein